MRVLPREEAKARILRLIQERADRSRYIVGDKLSAPLTQQPEVLSREEARALSESRL